MRCCLAIFQIQKLACDPAASFLGGDLGTRNAAHTAMIKKLILSAVAVLVVAVVNAQLTTSSPDPKSGAEVTGTIKEYTPGIALVLETLAPTEPVQFKLAKTVAYADKDGKPIEAAGLTTNQKVRVHYTKVGGDNVADKISLIGN
jgi:hypothetical protein